MKTKTILLLILTALPCLATTSAPYRGEHFFLDQLFLVASSQSPKQQTALKILELVSLGKADAADAQLPSIGITAGRLRGGFYGIDDLRGYALRKIADVDLPEALEFLEGLRQEDIIPGSKGTLWPEALIAVRQARLNRIPDAAGKIAFLEATVHERNAAVEWAIQELCNRGSIASLPAIREALHRRGKYGDEDEFHYCEERVAVLARSPDRVSALASYLRTSDPLLTNRLRWWAIGQLGLMNSERADAELKQYAAELDKLLPSVGDPVRKINLTQDREQIRDVFEYRKRLREFNAR